MVTGGQHLNAVRDVLTKTLASAGLTADDIFTSQRVDLPGFYRPTKKWDLVVVRDGHLLAAIELKAQVGPSFGNNFNNRTEEAIGTAVCTWTAFRDGAFAGSPPPWLGYLFLLEDCPASRRPVRSAEPHFPVFPEFRDASYARRMELFCLKLVRERQYSGSCFLLADSSRASERPNYVEPALELSAERFLGELVRHVRLG